MLIAGGVEFRIRSYEEIEPIISPMAQIALATTHNIEDFNRRLAAYEGLDEDRQQELRMDRHTGLAHFKVLEHFLAWTVNKNFINNFSIASETADTSSDKRGTFTPANAVQLLGLPGRSFTPAERMHGQHATRASYLRALIVPECAELVIPLTVAASNHYAAWHGRTNTREARHAMRHLHKGLRAAHNIMASLTAARDPRQDLGR